MSKKFPENPQHPERICWGCDKYCSVDQLACGNGSERTQHPSELFGDDWLTPILGISETEHGGPPIIARRSIPILKAG
ncbi:MAG: DUF3079 domain-containing protein [Gammaproteobacteria bacterium]